MLNFDFSIFNSYQSFDNKNGIRPTDERLKRYGIEAYLNSNHSVLDIGCNIGIFSILLARRARHVIGVEIHEPFFREAQTLKQQFGSTNCDFLLGDFMAMDFGGKRFDVILSLAAHLWMGDLAEYTKRLRSLSAPGALVLLESHDLQHPHNLEQWRELKDGLKPYDTVTRLRFEESARYGTRSCLQLREFVLLNLK